LGVGPAEGRRSDGGSGDGNLVVGAQRCAAKRGYGLYYSYGEI